MQNKKKKGFTLIEMIVVIAILAVLSIAIIPLISNLIDKSRVSRFLADSDLVRTAALSVQADIGTLDDSIFFADANNIMLSTLVVNRNLAGNQLGKWDGPYLEEGVDTHPWGGVYGLLFLNIDNAAPPTNNTNKILDLILRARNQDGDTLATPVPQAIEIATELNSRVTGEAAGGNTVRAVANVDEVDLVVVANVSE